MAATVEVRLSVGSGEDELDTAYLTLSELGASAVEILDDEEPVGVVAFFGEIGPDEARLAAASALEGAGVEVLRIEAREPASLDAGSIWQGHLRSIEVGPLVVVPAGRATAQRQAGLRSGGRVLELDSTGAFGSGLHVTTAMCLERIVALSPIESLLDVGTGTGILALSALALGGERAVATDTDRAALELTRANAERNHLADRLELTSTEPGDLGRQFSVTVANIVTAVLLDLSRELVRVVGHRGLLILSGIRDHEAADVARVFRDLGLRKVGEDARDGWTMLELEASW